MIILLDQNFIHTLALAGSTTKLTQSLQGFKGQSMLNEVGFAAGFIQPVLKQNLIIQTQLLKERSGSISFVPFADCISHVLNSNQLSILRDVAECKLVLPPINPIEGRTIYANCKKDSWGNIPGVKMKGGAGIANNYYLPPINSVGYRARGIDHAIIDPDLNVNWKSGNRNTFNSLRATAARTEYRCQSALAKANIGFPPLLAGSFLDKSNRSKLDLFGFETGAVFSQFDQAFSPLAYYVHHFSAPGIGWFKPLKGHILDENRSFIDSILYYLTLIEQVAALKQKCFAVARVGRHACHYGNILYKDLGNGEGELFVSDTDSCILFDDLKSEFWGPQLLRDIGSDLFRMVKDFMIRNPLNHTFNRMFDYEYKPFEAFLRGTFGGLLPEASISFHGRKLQAEYLEYIETMISSVELAFQDCIDHWTGQPGALSEESLNANWSIVNLPFYSVIFSELYQMIRESSLGEIGFTLKVKTKMAFREIICQGIREYLLELARRAKEIGQELESCPVFGRNSALDTMLRYLN